MSKKHRKHKKKQRKDYQEGHKMQNVNQGYYWKNCHNGPINVFNVGNSKIYAGSQWEIDCSVLKFDLFICANGDKGQFTSLVKLDDTRGLLAATQNEIEEHLTPSFLTLDIPDGGAPDIGPRFWKSLVSDIRDKELSIAVYCQGGHGRTGLVLACLAHFGGMVRLKQDVVKFIRGCYCVEAVETTTQINYLKRMGMSTEELPAFKPVVIGQPASTATTRSTMTQQGAVHNWNIKEGTDGVMMAVRAEVVPLGEEKVISEVPAGEKLTTQEEIAEWEKEMLLEEQAKEHGATGSAWDYSG